MLPPDVLGAVVVHGSMPSVTEPRWTGPLGPTSQHVTANPTLGVLTVPGVGAFAAQDGRRVVVELTEGGDEVLAEAHLYGTLAALLLGQQGRLALHATTVTIDGVAVAIAGRSGAGKSTTGLALAGRGHRLVADDVCALATEGGDGLAVTPFGRPVHAWRDTFEALGMSPGPARFLPVSGKLVLPPPAAEPVVLRAMVVLRPDPDADGVAVDSLTPSEALGRVARQIFRRPVVAQVWPEVVFRWMTAVAATIPVFVIRRPTEEWTAPEVADAIEELATTTILTAR